LVNERVSFRTIGGYRVVSVDGVILHHYSIDDRMAEVYAMVTLVETGYAHQNDVARAFGYTSRTLRRYQQRFEEGGLQALGRSRGRPAGTRALGPGHRNRDKTIMRLKREEISNRGIARRLGIDEKAIRKRLRKLGWQSREQQLVFFEEQAESESSTGTDQMGADASAQGRRICRQTDEENETEGTTRSSFDTDPLDRSLDRLLAALGLLDDAIPLFAASPHLPRAGVLLAIPPLMGSGLLAMATKVYGNIGPAFYGLRTTIVAFVLFALLRIKRPEALKEYAPGDLGRILGLDRAPEVKTLRRKLTRLAAVGRAVQFGRELAQQRVAERGRTLGFLYIDGHVRVYHGKRTLPKAYASRVRLALPATTDYWINDKRGDPLFVVTAEANDALTKILPEVLNEIRKRPANHIFHSAAPAATIRRGFWQGVRPWRIDEAGHAIWPRSGAGGG